MTLLIDGAVVVTCDSDHTILDPGDVVIDGDRLSYVGPLYRGPYDDKIDGTDRLLMPGLINTHTHSAMTLFRGLCDDVDLAVFLADRVWPREVHLTGEDVYAGAMLAAVEMLKGGVTTYVDMYFHPDDLLRAALDSGARGVITPPVVDVEPWTAVLGSWEKQAQAALDWCKRWDGYAGRIHAGVGPHAPYTVPLDGLREIAAEARSAGFPVNIHLVETAEERDAFNRLGQGSTVHALQERGFFDADVIVAHSVWLDDGDVEIYARNQVGVAHCPQSNAKLGAGVAPVASMLAHGVKVGLGTDGAATNNNLDLWEELRLAPLLAKVWSRDPKPVPAREALWMATRLGGEAIRIPDIGVLGEGCRADLVMLDLRDSTAVPTFGPQSYIGHLVYAAGRDLVDSVWVNGTRVVEDGEVLSVDEAEVRRQAQRTAMALSESVHG